MSNIPTAVKFQENSNYQSWSDSSDMVIRVEDARELMIEFAKMHVKECKLQIIEQFSIPVYKDLIINTYPLTNIK